MEPKDLVSFYFERTNAMQVLWSFGLTVILGLLAFFGSIKPSPRTTRVAAILSLTFVGLAYVNLTGLLSVTRQRIAAAELIRSSHSDTSPGQAAITAIAQTLDPPTTVGVISLHIFADIFTLAAVWTLALRKDNDEGA